ncbi:MAG TPA: HEAT repeat domain-containing protein [Anaerolineaceae bacterium]|nr:HEAT repeat domain-containing protein [Anaerolineaceae bacterium]HPN51120.1 HEAT repeat domain-containing protein [Anaerolineaceae bacterium]
MPKKQAPIAFKDVLDALVSKGKTFPPRFLYELSGLDGKKLKDIRRIWPDIPLERRRTMLEDLETLGEDDPLLSFEEIGKLAMTDPDGQVRATGIRLLWEVEDVQLVPVLINILSSDPEEHVRATAATALGKFVYLGEMEEIARPVAIKVEDTLLDVLHGSEPTLIRRRALESLGFSSRPELEALINKAYTDKDQDWRVSALFAMSRTADEKWNPLIMRALDDENDAIQFEAVRAAGELTIPEARLPLLRLVDETTDEDLQAAAIWSLSQIGGQDVREKITALLEDSEEDEDVEFLENALENLDFTEQVVMPGMIELDDLDLSNFADDADDDEDLRHKLN